MLNTYSSDSKRWVENNHTTCSVVEDSNSDRAADMEKLTDDFVTKGVVKLNHCLVDFVKVSVIDIVIAFATTRQQPPTGAMDQRAARSPKPSV
ncbi:hypothetical protein EVAR_11843_1 [Eumeta japonica]|uniref:Uncharacterized protein n=1 Tax=Eumeta variegata TaxID=151549 RepID=A0A4C1YKL3_EUMVA|nr:hypothetical protein EVAR_11843_1 [Eumeta japonica]